MFWQTSAPNQILLDLNFIKIYWYGFLITIAFTSGFFIFNFLAQRTGFKKEKIFDLFFWLVIGGIIGARLYHCFAEFNYYWRNPLKIFYLWQGGLAIYGAILAGLLVIYFFAKKTKESLGALPFSFYLLDLLAPALSLGQAIGRWGNFFNQELYGQPTSSFFGIFITPANRLINFENYSLFQPLFFYESLFCLLIFSILFLLSIYKHPKIPGKIFLLYIFLYSTWRFTIEFLRIDPQPIFLNLRLGQWVSLILIFLATIFYLLIKKCYNKNNLTL